MLEWPALAAYPSQATRPATLQGGQQWRGVPPKGRPRAHYAQAPTASGSTSGGHLTPCHRVDSVDWTGGGGAGRPTRGALSSADCWARGLSGCGFIRHPDFRPRPTDCQAARVLARFDRSALRTFRGRRASTRNRRLSLTRSWATGRSGSATPSPRCPTRHAPRRASRWSSGGRRVASSCRLTPSRVPSFVAQRWVPIERVRVAARFPPYRRRGTDVFGVWGHGVVFIRRGEGRQPFPGV